MAQELRFHNGNNQILVAGYWRSAMERTCIHCGSIFFTVKIYPSDVKHGHKGIFCTRACQYEHQTERFEKTHITRQCAICGRPYSLIPSDEIHRRTCGRPECKFAMHSITSKERFARRRAEKAV